MNAHIEDFHTDLDLIVDRLITQARGNDALAALLRRQALRLLEALDAASPPGQAIPDNGATLPATVVPGAAEQAPVEPVHKTDAPHGPPNSPLDHHLELAGVCRLKARAADWRARTLAGEHAPFHERELMIHEAGDAGVFLWTVTRQPEGELCRDATRYRRLADTYLACAEALEAWEGFPLYRARELLLLVAEAQSMIRTAAADTGLRRPEDTAMAVHQWLCAVAADIRVYIPRFMRAGELADPALAADLRDRVMEAQHPLNPDLPPPALMEDPAPWYDDTTPTPARSVRETV
jgi:hypothetical protein